MSDKSPGKSGSTPPPKSVGDADARAQQGQRDNGRRQGDRRKTDQPFEGPDRRKGDRRSGTDRRKEPRQPTR